MKKAAFWLPLAVGILWIGIGLSDLFAASLFNFSGSVASSSKMILDFAAGAVFLFVAFTFRKAKTKSPDSLPLTADKS